MKLLVVGCSLSSGWGFSGGKEDPQIWPNLLAKKLNASVTNLSETGYDNTGIFLNLLEEVISNDYDLILVQLTALKRIVISPNINGHRLIGKDNISNNFVNDRDYLIFFKVLTILNQGFEHWNRLLRILTILQDKRKLNVPIKFINGFLNWDKEFFDNDSSDFMSEILDEKSLPNEKIMIGRKLVNKSKKKINLDLWINPFNSFQSCKIDNVGPMDPHPGVKSQEIFADLVYDNLMKNFK